MTLGPRETRALLERHGLRPRTAIGQHFITDPNSVRRIVEIAGVSPGAHVLEVGPGLGALTRALLDAGAHVTAVERDRALAPALAEVAPEAQVLWEDAMAIDMGALLAGRPTVMVANLPYQIATPLIVDLLEERPEIASYTVMVQREVGERLVAAPASAGYGAVSAKVAYLAIGRVAMRVSRRVFLPMPEVESVVVRLDRRPQPPVPGDREAIFAVVEAGFAHRRKTMRRALRAAGWDAEVVERALTAADVPGEARAETLPLESFAALAAELGPR